MMRTCVLMTLSLLVIAPRALASEQTVILALRVFPCAKDSQTEPSLRVSDVARTFASVPINAKWSQKDGLWESTFEVPPGHYIVSSGSEHCTGETEQWIAMPGPLRHLVITMNKSKVVAVDEDVYAGAIYGYLPSPIAKVEVAWPRFRGHHDRPQDVVGKNGAPWQNNGGNTRVNSRSRPFAA